MEEREESKEFIKGILLQTLLSIGLTILLYLIMPTSIGEAFSYLKARPLLIVLNLLPILLLAYTIYFITGRPYLSSLIVLNMTLALGIANRLKILYRNEPMVPHDIFLWAEAIKISMQGKYQFDIRLFILFIAFNLALIFFVKIIDLKAIKSRKRIIYSVISIIIMFSLYKSVYVKSSLYTNFPTYGNIYNEVNNFNSKGFVYSFVHNIRYLRPEKPSQFKKSDFKGQSESYKATLVEDMPNIVMIMGEAFSDISENIEDELSIDPIRNYKEILKEADFKGHLIVPVFGGGTADTEFDSLTGMSTALLSGNGTYSYRFIRSSIISIPRQFRDLGYKAIGMHPGFDWFYNRINVYSRMGFNERIFSDSFSPEDIKGQYMSEEATYRRIKEDLTIIRENPIFYYCVTIQNHGPYDEGKYAEGTMKFVDEGSFTGKTREYLDNYFQGIYDMDKELGELKEMLEKDDRPFILVYYGDHLPFLGAEDSGYKDIGLNINRGNLEGYINYYKTPYVIWGNEAGREYLKKIKEIPRTMSASYLGVSLLEPVIGKCHPFFKFVYDLRKEYPIISSTWVEKEKDFVLTEEVLEDDLIRKYRQLQYYYIME